MIVDKAERYIINLGESANFLEIWKDNSINEQGRRNTSEQ